MAAALEPLGVALRQRYTWPFGQLHVPPVARQSGWRDACRGGLLWLLAALLLGLLAGCDSQPADDSAAEDEHMAAARGLEHFKTFQCASCHSTDWGPVPEQSCAACHDRIEDVALGRREYADQPTLQRYTETQIAIAHDNIVHLKAVPQLDGVARLFRTQWLEQYLQSPHDLRPRLEETMPRLRINAEQARDLVAYLQVLSTAPAPALAAPSAEPPAPTQESAEPSLGDVTRGRDSYDALGCAACHAFSGVTEQLAPRGNRGVGRGVLLAPDLAITRQRFRPERLADYIFDPQRERPSAAMPHYDLSRQQASDLAAFILLAELTPPPAQPAATFLPLLSRPVGYQEVAARIFSRICVHCHGPTTGQRVADGPGNSGGFGFLPRQLDLSSYEGVRAGVMFEGKRSGILRADTAGEEPLLIKVLKARHNEERAPIGAALPELRGMPLGLPALSLQDVQLVQSWVAQGAPYRALPLSQRH